MTLAVLVIHGIGEAREGYADRLVQGVEATLGSALRSVLPAEEFPPMSGLLTWAPARWDQHVTVQQDALRRALERDIPAVRFRGSWWRWWEPLLRRTLFGLRARVVPFVSDLLAYQRADAKELIYRELDAAVSRLASRTAPTPTPLSVIAHSLGTVIASDYLWDRTHPNSPQRLSGLQLANFFTLGSPMAFYALRYAGGVEAFDQPITMAWPGGCWVNCYHPDDPLATPLRRLNAAYEQAVLQDAEVRSGTLLKAHTSYWSDPAVHRIISHKLALDWLSQAHRLDADRLARLREAYTRRLSIA